MKWLIVFIFVILVPTIAQTEEVYYEIRCLESNDKGEIEKINLHNATVYKFKKIMWKEEPVNELVELNKNVDVEIKIYK